MGITKIKAFDAWDIAQGVDTVLLGIIDTGIDYDHPDLANKIFVNSGETGTDQFGNDKKVMELMMMEMVLLMIIVVGILLIESVFHLIPPVVII